MKLWLYLGGVVISAIDAVVAVVVVEGVVAEERDCRYSCCPGCSCM